jgi:hypothetical protein
MASKPPARIPHLNWACDQPPSIANLYLEQNPDQLAWIKTDPSRNVDELDDI